MMQFAQSPFLQALGYSIISSLWQFSILWLIYLGINSVISFSSHKKYAAALSLQVAGFFWFITTFIFYYLKYLYLSQSENTSYTEGFYLWQSPFYDTFRHQSLWLQLNTEKLVPFLGLAYLIFSFGLCINWIKSYRYTQSLGPTHTGKIDVHYRLFVGKLAGHLGIKRQVTVLVSHLINSPITFGHFKPVILLPIACINNLSCIQVEAILLHELAHIKRFDYLFNLILSLIDIVLFFNPFMHLLHRHIKRERENSCDDWVLQFEYSAYSYAEALVKVATHQHQPGFALKAVDQRKSLLARVKRMLDQTDRTYNYRNKLFIFILLFCTINFVAYLTTGVDFKNEKTLASGLMPTPIGPLTANSFLNPVRFPSEDEKLEFSTLHLNAEAKHSPIEASIADAERSFTTPETLTFVMTPDANPQQQKQSAPLIIVGENDEVKFIDSLLPDNYLDRLFADLYQQNDYQADLQYLAKQMLLYKAAIQRLNLSNDMDSVSLQSMAKTDISTSDETNNIILEKLKAKIISDLDNYVGAHSKAISPAVLLAAKNALSNVELLNSNKQYLKVAALHAVEDGPRPFIYNARIIEPAPVASFNHRIHPNDKIDQSLKQSIQITITITKDEEDIKDIKPVRQKFVDSKTKMIKVVRI